MGNPELSLGASATLCRRVWGGGCGEAWREHALAYAKLTCLRYLVRESFLLWPTSC